uniref:Uncharacterized protein LOC104245059 n=1 Tax=Nicotiana sylvestris TaxID=4096 RepID=A0A1U7Y464_NICSY|nr:PREDICTED: uncharacterized protein LOC104245059 [Nicotiana sylvestris]
MIWVKGLSFKISFFMWKVWKAKLPLDDFMRRLGYFMPSRCWCCIDPQEESLTHLFFTSHAAKIVWKYFLARAGIKMEGLTLHQAITRCWTARVLPRMKPIMQALPSCIIWELWKRRNSYKYGEAIIISRVIYQVSSSLQALVRVRKLGLSNIPHKWHDLLNMLENYTPRLSYEKVIWEMPREGWVKVNTDGASRGNPGRSSIGVCIRNEVGDVTYALGREIDETINTEAESVAILEALRICLWKPPWSIVDYMEEIWQLMSRGNFKVTHIFREGNKLADHLTNYALDVGDIEGYDFWHLDSIGRRIVNEDKLQCNGYASLPCLLKESQIVVSVSFTQSIKRKSKASRGPGAKQDIMLSSICSCRFIRRNWVRLGLKPSHGKLLGFTRKVLVQ